MFYRLETYITTHNRLWLEKINRKARGIMRLSDFEHKFAEIRKLSETPECVEYLAPQIDFSMWGNDFQLQKGNETEEIPDIMTFEIGEPVVSHKVKEIIEEFDDFEHQFHPTNFVDHKGNQVNEQPYFLMNVRRFLRIEKTSSPIKSKPKRATRWELKHYSSIETSSQLRAEIEKIPLWRGYRQKSVLYLNSELVEQLRSAGVTGMDEYPHPSGSAKEECLVRV